MQFNMANFKASFSATSRQTDAGQVVIITNWGKPVYRLPPVIPTHLRTPFPDTTNLALQSNPSPAPELGSFVADWRAQNERFAEVLKV